MNVKLNIDITSRRPGGVIVRMSCRECPTNLLFPDVVIADIGLLIQRWENHSHRCSKCGFRYGVEPLATCGHDAPKVADTTAGYIGFTEDSYT